MKKLNKLTLGAMVTAIITVLFHAATFIQTGTVAICYVISLMLMAVVIETGLQGGIICYAVTSVLIFITAPDKGMAMGYVLFFGLFPVLKSLFERPHKQVLQIFLKLVFFVIVSFSALLIFSAFIATYSVLFKIGIGLIAVAFMFLYDYILTLGITYYSRYLAERIFRSRKP